MSATVLKFNIRGVNAERQVARSDGRTVARIRAGGRYGFYRENDYTAKIPLPAFQIIVRVNPPFASLSAGKLAGEDCADFCCNFSGSFDRGAVGQILNSCRVFNRDNGNLFLRALQPLQKSTSRAFQAFETILRCLVLVHDEQPSDGALHCQTIPLKDRTKCL